MNIISRLGRFSAVGLVATGIHATVLVALISLGIGNGLANLSGFLIAFICSFFGQQALTFKDRLGEKRLNKRAAAVLLIVNSSLAIILGQIAPAVALPALPILPAATNYILLWIFTGRSFFIAN
ncbi:GtrA family protein [Synechococcus sp. CS-1329]|uniref:GtrA family protein n=1 Tax=Synechococcus sp. CS-1329 TaxID=2847975 RepID=UPI0021E38E3F|nr:GtrA family protein [Synechococcus sp. CS-1329]MCT0219097.1 GtrA family protein [Synechococcus sp. CS-1329]